MGLNGPIITSAVSVTGGDRVTGGRERSWDPWASVVKLLL